MKRRTLKKIGYFIFGLSIGVLIYNLGRVDEVNGYLFTLLYTIYIISSLILTGVYIGLYFEDKNTKDKIKLRTTLLLLVASPVIATIGILLKGDKQDNFFNFFERYF